MRRDMSLIRAILLFAEQQDTQWYAQEADIDGSQQKDVVYNVGLAIDGGLLDGADASLLGPDGKDFIVKGITYKGHDFLDEVRDIDKWEQVTQEVKKRGLAFTIDVFVTIAKELAVRAAAAIYS